MRESHPLTNTPNAKVTKAWYLGWPVWAEKAPATKRRQIMVFTGRVQWAGIGTWACVDCSRITADADSYGERSWEVEWRKHQEAIEAGAKS